MERALYYRPSDGFWWEGRAREGLLYILEQGERWALLDDGSVMVVHPDRSPKVVYPDGRVEDRPHADRAERIAYRTALLRSPAERR
jgi:hypothetical protein